jgi:cell division protease FtsH
MEQNNQKQNGPKMNMPRFNMNWIYFLVIVTLGFLYLSNDNEGLQQPQQSETSYTEFQAFMDRGYASRLVVNKSQGTLRMYVKSENIRDVFHKNSSQVGSDPYLTV